MNLNFPIRIRQMGKAKKITAKHFEPTPSAPTPSAPTTTMEMLEMLCRGIGEFDETKQTVTLGLEQLAWVVSETAREQNATIKQMLDQRKSNHTSCFVIIPDGKNALSCEYTVMDLKAKMALISDNQLNKFANDATAYIRRAIVAARSHATPDAHPDRYTEALANFEKCTTDADREKARATLIVERMALAKSQYFRHDDLTDAEKMRSDPTTRRNEIIGLRLDHDMKLSFRELAKKLIEFEKRLTTVEEARNRIDELSNLRKCMLHGQDHVADEARIKIAEIVETSDDSLAKLEKILDDTRKFVKTETYALQHGTYNMTCHILTTDEVMSNLREDCDDAIVQRDDAIAKYKDAVTMRNAAIVKCEATMHAHAQVSQQHNDAMATVNYLVDQMKTMQSNWHGTHPTVIATSIDDAKKDQDPDDSIL